MTYKDKFTMAYRGYSTKILQSNRLYECNLSVRIVNLFVLLHVMYILYLIQLKVDTTYISYIHLLHFASHAFYIL